MAKSKEKQWKIEDVAPGALICRGPADEEGNRLQGCGVDLRDHIAEMLNSGELQEDGVTVSYECPECGAAQRVSRTPPAVAQPD